MTTTLSAQCLQVFPAGWHKCIAGYCYVKSPTHKCAHLNTYGFSSVITLECDFPSMSAVSRFSPVGTSQDKKGIVILIQLFLDRYMFQLQSRHGFSSLIKDTMICCALLS